MNELMNEKMNEWKFKVNKQNANEKEIRHSWNSVHKEQIYAAN